jgi:dephospho-CoA kinase
MFVLGLTGGIATGKSTASKIFKKLGAYIIDADKISHEVSKSKEIINEVKKKFGTEVIINNKIDREKLGKIIFNDPQKRMELNNIMHPVIIREILKKIDENREKKLIILDIPLLYEAKLENLCDKVLVVWVKKEVQIERIIKRDNKPRELALKIIESQMDISKKIKMADYNIENNESISELENKITVLYEKLIKKS